MLHVQAAIERRKAAAFISGMHGGNPPPSPGKVRRLWRLREDNLALLAALCLH